MCGLFGFVGAGLPDPDLLREAAERAGTRGPHSWGQVWIDDGNLRQLQATRYTGPLDPKQVKTNARALVGHARLATTSAKPIGSARAMQPLIRSPQAIAHNGTVPNEQEIYAATGWEATGENDSEAILALFVTRSASAILAATDPSVPMAVLTIDPKGIHALRRTHPLYVLARAEGFYFCSRSFGPDGAAELLPEEQALFYPLPIYKDKSKEKQTHEAF